MSNMSQQFSKYFGMLFIDYEIQTYYEIMVSWYQHMNLEWDSHEILINVQWDLEILRKFWERRRQHDANEHLMIF